METFMFANLGGKGVLVDFGPAALKMQFALFWSLFWWAQHVKGLPAVGQLPR